MVIAFAADVSALCYNRVRLSQERRIRVERLRERDKRLSVGAETLLWECLARLAPELDAPLPVQRTEGGKPYIPNCPVRFSLSHSGVMALCAAGFSDLGADIQSIRQPRPGLTKRFFTEAERRAVEVSTDEAFEFTRLWTRKESYIKYLGAGLAKPLDSFDVTSDIVSDTLYPVSCRLWTRRAGDYMISLCAPELDDVLFHIGRLTEDGNFIEDV